MINNCQKCGNPVQEGVTSCPICGTNIDINNNIQPVAETQKVTPTEPVVQVAPMQNAEAQLQQTIAPEVVQSAPVVQQPTIVQPVAAPAVQVEPTIQTPVQSVTAQPAPVVQSTVQEAQMQPTTTIEQPVVQNTAPVVEQPTIVQPVAAPALQATPVAEQTPIIQTEIPTPVVPVMPTLDALVPKTEVVEVNDQIQSQTPSSTTETKANKKTNFNIKNLTKNQKIIAIAVVAVIIMVISGIFLSSSSLGKPTTIVQNNTPTEEIAVAKEVTSNGYKLKLEEGWMVEEDGTNVILKKEDDSVIISVQHLAMSLDYVTKDKINKNFTTQTAFSDVVIEQTNISGKDAYIIDCSYTSPTNVDAKYPIQYYYINGGSNLIIGATVVYVDEDAKTSNAAFVTNLIGTMSYSDDTVKALDTLNMYSNIIRQYGNLIKEPSIPSIEINPNENQINTNQNIEAPIIIQ